MSQSIDFKVQPSSGESAQSNTPNPSQSGKKSRLKKPSMKKPQPKWLALVGIIVILLAVGVFFAIKYNDSQKDVKRLSDTVANPQEAARLESEILISRVSVLAELPKDETPTVATVSDASKLKNQAFFKNAENGDKVLIYTKAKKAILYRPSTNKVIEIAPVNIGNNQNNTSDTTQTGQ